MEIPNVGVFLVRNGVAAVSFDEILVGNVRGITKRPIRERKERGSMRLTSEALSSLT